MSFDRAAAIGHFANTSGGTIRLGESPTLTQGDSYFAAIVNSAGTVIDNPGGQRTWGGSLRSGRRLWGPAGSEALDQSVTRPDATAKTFSLNLDNVAPNGDTLIVSVSGVGPFNEKLENLPGANFVIQIKPAPAGVSTLRASSQIGPKERIQLIRQQLDALEKDLGL